MVSQICLEMVDEIPVSVLFQDMTKIIFLQLVVIQENPSLQFLPPSVHHAKYGGTAILFDQ
jgi:hypothetical protein